MFKILSIISDLNDAAQAGQQLENAKVWANRGQAVSALTVIITFFGLVGSYFNVIPDNALSPDDIKTIALGIAAGGTVVTHILHRTTNPNSG